MYVMPEAIKELPTYVAFWRFWADSCRDGRIPEYNEVLAEDLGSLLPDIAILEWRGPNEVYPSLRGSHVVQNLGFLEPETNLLDLVWPPERDQVEEFFENVATGESYGFGEYSVHLVNGTWRILRLLVLPTRRSRQGKIRLFVLIEPSAGSGLDSENKSLVFCKSLIDLQCFPIPETTSEN